MLQVELLLIDTIQIQHLLKLNNKKITNIKQSSIIQIQHLLKLNNFNFIIFCFRFFIQIQHLLKLNEP